MARTEVIDLFCGIGGLTCGLRKAGLNVVAGIDSDLSCKYAYETNNCARFLGKDVTTLTSSEVDELYSKYSDTIKILVGCAPCQTFSSQAHKYRSKINEKTDKRWNLLRTFKKYVCDIKPVVVSMENVPELRKYDVFEDFVSGLESEGYHVDYKVVDCSKYGMPQKRRRLVLLASRLGGIGLIDESEIKAKRNVRDAIGGLPVLRQGESDRSDPLHKCAGLSVLNLKRIRQSRPGGTWADWDDELLPNCYRKASGKTYQSVYGRMEWDKPSPTITTQFYSYGSGRYGHPEQDRALSLREGALLQTFPMDYKFYDESKNVSIGTISRHIGNAVPVDLGKIVGVSIVRHLSKYGVGAMTKHAEVTE